MCTELGSITQIISGILFFRHSTCLFQRLIQQELYLSVYATEFILRPFLNGFHAFWIYAKNKAFIFCFFGHAI